MSVFKTLRARLDSFAGNSGAATTIIAAGSIMMIVGAAAFAVDIGSLYYSKRRAQQAVDLAAIAGAGALPNPEAAVRASLADNGFASESVAGGGGIPSFVMETLTITPGSYVADPAIAIQRRFQPASAAQANAVRVTMQRETPLYFGRVLTGKDSATLDVSSTAAAATAAAFSVGSRLLKLDGGVANAMLSALLGANISMSLMDYEALASARIEMFPFLDALGDEIGLRAATYNSLLETSAPIGKSYNAAARVAAASGHSRAADSLRRLAASTDVARLAVKLRDIVDLGSQGTGAIGNGPAVAAQFDALTLITTQAQLANASRQVAVNLGVSLPGLAGATLTLGVGERPVKSVWLANGRSGAEAHTAQTRLLLEAKLLGVGPAPAGLRLPVYVELAAADSRLAAVRCRANPAETRVEIDARPGVVDAWIADVGMAQFANMATPINPPAAGLATILNVAVTGRAHATMSNVSSDRLIYTLDDIRAARSQTVKTRDFTTSLTARLLADLQLKTQVAGVPLIDLTLATKTAANLIQTATPSIDTLLANTLAVLGIGLGEADIWANGVRCDGGVLVN